MIMSFQVMRSDKGITVIVIKDSTPEPEVKHFGDWVQTKEFLNTISI